LLVERWHSSSMQTRMAFWWNSSLTPIFYQTRNKTSENQNIVKIERKTPKNKAHTHIVQLTDQIRKYEPRQSHARLEVITSTHTQKRDL
jgi:hypothetical protein